MFSKLKSLFDRLLPNRFQPIMAGILSLAMVITSGFWWFPARNCHRKTSRNSKPPNETTAFPSRDNFGDRFTLMG
jgi:hypothetical protein